MMFFILASGDRLHLSIGHSHIHEAESLTEVKLREGRKCTHKSK
ncbi:hypothetical protein [Trichormus variabilis]|nr:hypothetical protein [Trichormus variabilis]